MRMQDDLAAFGDLDDLQDVPSLELEQQPSTETQGDFRGDEMDTDEGLSLAVEDGDGWYEEASDDGPQAADKPTGTLMQRLASSAEHSVAAAPLQEPRSSERAAQAASQGPHLSPMRAVSLDESFQQAKRTKVTFTSATGAGGRAEPAVGDELEIEIIQHISCATCPSSSKERVQLVTVAWPLSRYGGPNCRWGGNRDLHLRGPSSLTTRFIFLSIPDVAGTVVSSEALTIPEHVLALRGCGSCH